MKCNILFSVLIANYNNGRYLQEAIDSVLAQTYTNWEIVIVDDKSTDNSFEIYEKYRDDGRFRIFYNEENKGCGYTKRRCVELAKGELCGFLDPDDRLEPVALSVMVGTHGAHPECSLIYSTLYLWDDFKDTKTILDAVGPMAKGEDFLVSSSKIVSHFAVFKKSFYDKTVGIDASLASAVDFDLYVKLEEAGELLFVDEPLYCYRQNNPSSISIGNEKNKNSAFRNKNRASLEAFCRRIKGRMPLYYKKKDLYLATMRWNLSYFHQQPGKESRAWLKYCYCYLWANHFSVSAVNHIRKIIVK